MTTNTFFASILNIPNINISLLKLTIPNFKKIREKINHLSSLIQYKY